MTTKTELDARFSDTDAEATTWAATVDVLESAELAWITTVRADGRPHVTPLVAVWLDDACHFVTGPTEQKAVNLDHEPRVAITTGSDDWDRGLDVVVEGTARRVTDPDALDRLAAAWTQKWDGRWRFEVDGTNGFRNAMGPVHVYEVRPDKVLAFAKRPFAQTRHLPG